MLKILGKNKKNILIIIFIFFLSFVLVMQSPLNIFSDYPVSGTDSSVFRTVAYYMNEGLMPYKDIFDHKGPIIYIINYFGMLISYNHGVWLLELIFMFITLTFMYKIARLRCNKFCSVLILLLISACFFQYFEQGNLTEEYALPFISISLYLFLDYFKNNNLNKFRLVLCGICFALVCLLRVNMVSIWIVFCLMVMVKKIQEKKLKELVNYLFYFMIGFAIVLAPIFIWLAINGAFLDFVNDYIIFNIKYSTDPVRATLFNKWSSLSFFVNTPLFIMTICLCVLSCYKKLNLLSVGYLLCLVLTCILIAISGQTYPHYGMILVPLMIFPFSLFFDDSKNLLILILFLTLVSIPNWINGANNVVSYCNDKLLNANKEEQITEYLIANDVMANSNKNDKITVFGNMNIIYLLSQRLSSSRYTYQIPVINVDNNIRLEYFNDLEKNKPKIIVKAAEDDALEKFIVKNNYEEISNYNDGKIVLYIK